VQEAVVTEQQLVQEYSCDVLKTMLRREKSYMAKPGYMNSQHDIIPRMRSILIDWLVDVYRKYGLRRETLFLTVNLVDRYLSRVPLRRRRLQLVGVAAMFIASKFEEIRPPEALDFVYITDRAYTKEELLEMEMSMLQTLNFEVAGPTAAHFMAPLQSANECDAAHRELVWYLASLSLLEVKCMRHLPSHLASAALMLSNEALGRHPIWPQALVDRCGYSEQVLRPCAEELRALHRASASDPLKAVRNYFSSTNIATGQFAVAQIKF